VAWIGGGRSGDTKVSHLDGSLLGDQEVTALDVAMYNALRVEILESVEYLLNVDGC